MLRERGRQPDARAYNLYYFGPRPKDCEKDPEEAERAKTVFACTEVDEETRLLKRITHAIWDLLEAQITDETVENVPFRF